MVIAPRRSRHDDFERKALALSRLKLRRESIRKENKSTEYLDGLIAKLNNG